VLLLDGGQAADARADDDADAVGVVGQALVPAGVRQRLVGGREPELREAVA
jgi:hypothetical protein